MKHARSDYNDDDLTLRIPHNEPVFLIRAQDVVSGDAVRAWANLHDLAGGDPPRRKNEPICRVDTSQ